MNRRYFIKSSALGATALAPAPLWSVHPPSKKLKISLAQWSLHRSFNSGNLDPVDFAAITKNTYHLDAVEYVNGFYTDHASDDKFWMEMNNRASGVGVKSVKELLPYAKAVSAKSYNFNEKGEDTKIDYYRMLKIVKESKYDGYIGIEYEGEILGEHEGILTTKALMEKVWNSL